MMRLYGFAKMIPAVAILYCASTALQSCHKKKNSNGPGNVTYDFSTGGNTLLGYTVTFQSTAPATSTFLWSFGDGATSTTAYPTHVYTKVDSFTVILIVDGNSAKKVSKTIFISTPPNATIVAGMGGMKYWHGYIIADFQSPTLRDTLSVFTDQFTISVLNSTTLALKDDTLACYYTDPINQIYYFRHSFSLYSWREVAYYYGTGNIFYTYQPDQGGDPAHGPYSSATVLWTP